MDTESNEAKFGIPDIGIPAEILFNSEITKTEKILFGFLRNLSQTKRGCWASNRYLGSINDIKPQTVSVAISHLKKWRYINVEYSINNAGVSIRRIYINPDYPKIYRKLVTDWYKNINEANSAKERTNGVSVLEANEIKNRLSSKTNGGIIKIKQGYSKNGTKDVIEVVNKFDNDDDAKILNTKFSVKKEKILNTKRDENFAENFLKEKKDDFSAAPLVKNYFPISLSHYKELYDKDHIEFNHWLSKKFKDFDSAYLASALQPKFFNGIYHIFPKSKYPGTKESGKFAFEKFCRKKDNPVLGEILFAVFAQMKSSRWQTIDFISSLKNWFDKDKWEENPAEMINKDKKKHGKYKTKKSTPEEGPMPTRT